MVDFYNEIIVVEGKNDKSKILSIYPNANVLITNGSEVSKEFIDNLKVLSKKHSIILLLDPDYPGLRIRSIIENNIPTVKHAFVEKKYAICEQKHKVGIEHCEDQVIIDALNNLLTKSDQSGSLTISDLYDLKLIGYEKSRELREKVGKYFPIGYTNGKSLLKRLNYLNISKEELSKIL